MSDKQSAAQRVRTFLEQWLKELGRDEEKIFKVNNAALNRTDLEIVLLGAESSDVHKSIEKLDDIVERWREANNRQKDSIGRLVGKFGKIGRLCDDETKTPMQRLKLIKETLDA